MRVVVITYLALMAGMFGYAVYAAQQKSTAVPVTTLSTPAAVVPVAAPAPVITPAPAPTPVRPDPVKVSRVIDGDTFELVGGEKVRVLGIDSCEMNTPGGEKALESAKAFLEGPYITLRTEPGVDRDRYGRLLRYVNTTGIDFGSAMVKNEHTGVYQGKNDANATYLAQLRAADYDGRNCAGDPVPPPVTEDHYVPVPSGGDDNDGGKSRFCRRHWYC